MSGPSALALTGVAFVVAAVILAFAADAGSVRNIGRYAAIGWLAFSLALAAFVGSVWWEALS